MGFNSAFKGLRGFATHYTRLGMPSDATEEKIKLDATLRM